VTLAKKRARSLEDKSFRRQQILYAAAALFQEVGYEGFSVALLASKAGVVKGTLYLYFKTREEVFLALYDQSLNRVSECFIAQLTPGITDRAFCELLYEVAFGDSLYVPLQARLEKVIEHNVSINSLIASKRNFLTQVGHIAAATAAAIDLDHAQAIEFIKTLGVLIVGVAGAHLAPSLEGEDIPDDIQALLDSFASKPIFVTNAHRILRGIHAGDSD
jgi:AcrR family transcriptional regulator